MKFANTGARRKYPVFVDVLQYFTFPHLVSIAAESPSGNTLRTHESNLEADPTDEPGSMPLYPEQERDTCTIQSQIPRPPVMDPASSTPTVRLTDARLCFLAEVARSRSPPFERHSASMLMDAASSFSGTDSHSIAQSIRKPQTRMNPSQIVARAKCRVPMVPGKLGSRQGVPQCAKARKTLTVGRSLSSSKSSKEEMCQVRNERKRN